jgi:hypothetical protein
VPIERHQAWLAMASMRSQTLKMISVEYHTRLAGKNFFAKAVNIANSSLPSFLR